MQTKPYFDPRWNPNTFIPFTSEQLEAMKTAYLANESPQKIADRFGISPATLRSRLRDMGVELHPRGPIRRTVPQVIEDALALKAAGAEWPQIQELLGVRWEAMASEVRKQRAEQREALEKAQRRAEELEQEVERLGAQISSLKGSCAALGKKCKDATRGLQSAQRALSWLMHNRQISLDGIPGWIMRRMRKLLEYQDKPVE